MKKLLIIGLLAANAIGADLNLAWDASVPIVYTNDVIVVNFSTNGIPFSTTNYEIATIFATNYWLYAHNAYLTEANKSNSLVKINAGTNLTATVENLSSGRWFFAATAVGNNGLESLLSNVLAVEAPNPPANMRTIVLQYSGTLSNFYDVGFFRLRLP